MSQHNAIHDGGREATDAEVDEVMADGERALDVLVRLFLDLQSRDRAAGNPSDEPALGGIAMALDDLGHVQLMVVASLAIRRVAGGVSRG